MPRCDRLNCASQRGNIGSPPAPGLQVYSRSAIDFVAASGSVFWPLFAFKWLVKLLLVLDRFNRLQPNAIHELKLNAHPPAGVNMPSDYRLNLLAFALRQRVESFTNVLRELHSSSSFSNYRPQRRLKTLQRFRNRQCAFAPIFSSSSQAAKPELTTPRPFISNETAVAWIVAAILTASWTCSSLTSPATSASSCERTHTSQPLIALTARQNSSKSALSFIGLPIQFIRSRAGFAA